jgi:drug/metabolite transporter (DMT)-like permease
MTSVAQQTQRRLGQVTGILLVNLATLTWAINMTLGRWLRDQIGPLTLSAARIFIASLLLAMLLRQRPPEERSLGRDRWLLLGMAASGVVVFTPLLYLGLRFTTAVNATLINGLGPLITGLLAVLLIREPMSGRQMAGATLGLAGVVILISGGSPDFWQVVRGNVGDLIVLLAVALWGLYSVLSRQVTRHRSTLSATALSTFLGLPLLLLAAAWEVQTFPVDTSPELILAVLYIGIFPATVGFLSWNAGIRRLGASGAMVFFNTLPLYGALLGHLFLAEAIGLAHLLGGALIVGGGLWAAWGRSQERESGS